MKQFFRFNSVLLICVFTLLNFFSDSTLAQSKKKSFEKNPELQVPGRLRPRVNFWIDIFGNYTKAQVIIHHRRFPQIRFALLDIEQVTAGMNDVLFDAYKDRALKAKLKEVREDIAFLAGGEAPQTAQQRNIEQAMRVLGPGVGKYLKIVKDPELVRGQSGIREKTYDAIIRAGRYLPVIEDIFVDEFGLPAELTRLPFVESSFDYRAYSSVAAAGIWQFMPRTARSYMRVTSTVDERLDPVESSRAAAKYLRSAYSRLGTWPLALTSYNHGVGGVLNKVRKFGTADIATLIEDNSEEPPFGFASTNFYPSFLAAKEIFERRAEFFPGLIPEPPLRIAILRLSRASTITEIKHRIGISEEELRRCNYALSERIWDARAAIPAGYNLKVPSHYEAVLIKSGFGEAVENFSVDATSRIEPKADTQVLAFDQSTKSGPIESPQDFKSSKPELATKLSATSSKEHTYKVRPGDTLFSVSKDFEISVADLKKANNIKNNSIFVGKLLNIPDSKASEKKQTVSKPKEDALVKLYTVKKGDTPGSIAKRMGIPLAKIISTNGLSAKKPTIKVGQVLRIPL